MQFSSRLAVWLLLGGAIAVACGPRAHSDEPPVAGAPAAPAKSGKPAKNTTMDSSRTLATSLRAAITGTEVRFAYHLTNVTGAKLELSFPSGQTHDFAIVDSTGSEVWRWGSDRMFTQAIQSKFLDAGETLTFTERWDTAGKRGRYTLVATLTSNSHPHTERIELTLP